MCCFVETALREVEFENKIYIHAEHVTLTSSLNKTLLWSRSEWNQIQTWHSLNKQTNSLLGFIQTSKEHKNLQGEQNENQTSEKTEEKLQSPGVEADDQQTGT